MRRRREEGAGDSSTCAVFLREVLVPTLKSGQILVLDTLNRHTQTGIQAVLEAYGCRLLYVPAYSPDPSPRELAFSTIKTGVRQVGARVREGLEEEIVAALDRITAHDVQI